MVAAVARATGLGVRAVLSALLQFALLAVAPLGSLWAGTLAAMRAGWKLAVQAMAGAGHGLGYPWRGAAWLLSSLGLLALMGLTMGLRSVLAALGPIINTSLGGLTRSIAWAFSGTRPLGATVLAVGLSLASVTRALLISLGGTTGSAVGAAWGAVRESRDLRLWAGLGGATMVLAAIGVMVQRLEVTGRGDVSSPTEAARIGVFLFAWSLPLFALAWAGLILIIGARILLERRRNRSSVGPRREPETKRRGNGRA